MPIRKIKALIKKSKLLDSIEAEANIGVNVKTDIGSKDTYTNSAIKREYSLFKKTEYNTFNFNYSGNSKLREGSIDIGKLSPETIAEMQKKFVDGNTPKQIFGAVKSSYAKAFDYLEYYYKNKKGHTKAFTLFNDETQSILNLSKYISELYKNKKRKLAREVKCDLIFKHGDLGKTICNLYTSGYIPSMFSAYLEKLFEKTDLAEAKELAIKILNQVISESKSIFFISIKTNVIQTIKEINGYTTIGRKYIAIHSAGDSNNSKAKKIYENTNQKARPRYKINKISRVKKGLTFFDAQYIKKVN